MSWGIFPLFFVSFGLGHTLAAPHVGKMAGNQIGERLDDAETDDEGDNKGGRGKLEFLGADQRHDGPFETDAWPELISRRARQTAQLTR